MEKPGREAESKGVGGSLDSQACFPSCPIATALVTPASHLPTCPDDPQHSCLCPQSLSSVLPSCHTSPQYSHFLAPSYLPSVPTSVPMASTTKSADLPTWPVSSPGPQARTFCVPASGLTWTSKGLGQRGSRCQCQQVPLPEAPSSPPSPCSLPPFLLPLDGSDDSYLRGMA